MPRPQNWSADINARRLEDLQFMAATGETATGAATRLGISLDALEKWCDRHGHRTLLNQLIANDHIPGHGARTGRFALGRVS